MAMTIRMENPFDREPVEQLVKTVFAAAGRSHYREHHRVRRLRGSKAFLPSLSLVAEKNDRLAGYILFTKAQLGSESILVLSPVAVHPDEQGCGIGRRLIEEGHKRAAALGYPGVVVMGEEGYYPRFGYQPAEQFGLTPSFSRPDSCFMVKELQDGALANRTGTVEFPKEFFEFR